MRINTQLSTHLLRENIRAYQAQKIDQSEKKDLIKEVERPHRININANDSYSFDRLSANQLAIIALNKDNLYTAEEREGARAGFQRLLNNKLKECLMHAQDQKGIGAFEDGLLQFEWELCKINSQSDVVDKAFNFNALYNHFVRYDLRLAHDVDPANGGNGHFADKRLESLQAAAKRLKDGTATKEDQHLDFIQVHFYQDSDGFTI